ncbi:MAG: M17 family peptidase N-terminal domain-containing protein, partial [Acidobacteriota bacterium]
MIVSVSTKEVSDMRADVLVCLVDSSLSLSGSLAAQHRKSVQAAVKKKHFQGEWGSSALLLNPTDLPISFLGLVGLGKSPDSFQKAEAVRRGIATLLGHSRGHGIRTFAILLHNLEEASGLAGALQEGVTLSEYQFSSYKKSLAVEQKRQSVRRLTFLVQRNQASAVRAEISHRDIILQGVEHARNLVNEPASRVVPAFLVKQARTISRYNGAISVRVLNREQARKQKFTAFLAVAKGSREEPYV